ncbi:hypothetical protein KUW17_08970 [Leisingera aquaemixtae]|uniref:hypothetical protein n=1 Tax=Leisingera aquaemixtae TaxID=1396826 RepID=UPI001C986001|nr:hypothetical protein [Leisingera aquaemixtae]MBY6066871.1 hypothetical protein [Leisingera aquaemixtae]
MSDPVTHAEIEDVLSSIRRLVSEDGRGQPAAPEPAARLVLTPALRVQEPAPGGNGPAGAGDAAEEAAADPVLQPAEEPPLAGDDESQADAGGAEASGAGLSSSAGSEDPPGPLAEDPPLAFRHRRDLAWDKTDRGSKEDAGEPAGQEDTPENASENSQENTPEDSQTGAAAQALEAGTGPAGSGAPWGNPETTLFAAAAGAAGEDGDLDEYAAEADPAPVRLAEDSLAASTAGARAASVVRKIAELEARSFAAQSAAQEQWEPDSQTEAPFAGTGPDTIEWRDEPLIISDDAPVNDPGMAGGADSRADSAPAEEQQPAAAAPTGMPDAETVVETAVTGAAVDSLAESGEGYLDEDALRDLVAGIVREELQGPLGERITRNVRKLVRREIHRALAAHDLV